MFQFLSSAEFPQPCKAGNLLSTATLANLCRFLLVILQNRQGEGRQDLPNRPLTTLFLSWWPEVFFITSHIVTKQTSDKCCSLHAPAGFWNLKAAFFNMLLLLIIHLPQYCRPCTNLFFTMFNLSKQCLYSVAASASSLNEKTKKILKGDSIANCLFET